jgi:hypothetical protein
MASDTRQSDVEASAGSSLLMSQSAFRLDRSRLTRFMAALYRQTLVDPVEQGRLRDVTWPYGLRSIVLAGYAVFAIAGLMVIFSGVIRGRSTLIVFGSGLGLPEQMVWPLVVVLSFGVASFMSAAQHGPWWLKVLGLLFTLTLIGTWSLRTPSLAGWVGWPLLAGCFMAALLAVGLIRWRREFAWWEFAVMWALVGLAMTIGVAETRESNLRRRLQPAHSATDSVCPRLPRVTGRNLGRRVRRRSHCSSDRGSDAKRPAACSEIVAARDLGGSRWHPAGPGRLADCAQRSRRRGPARLAMGQRAGDRVRCGGPDRAASFPSPRLGRDRF